MDPFTTVFWQGIGMASLCGTLVGLEREVREKPAGVRTSILIVLGTFVFVRLGASLAGPQVDPTRVLGQVATGIGFLGAGVILSRGGAVKGVTSAATVWVLAAIGATIGLGHYVGALALSIVTVLVLTALRIVDSLVDRARNKAGDEAGGTDA